MPNDVREPPWRYQQGRFARANTELRALRRALPWNHVPWFRIGSYLVPTRARQVANSTRAPEPTTGYD